MIIIQPDNSTTLILMTIVFTLLFIGGVSLPQIGTVGVLSVGSILIAIVNSKNYALSRIVSFLDPSSSGSVGYQSSQALIGLRQGGVSGMGIGDSIQKHSYLPETHTDFIFAIIGEELGFILGTVPVLTLFLYIFLRGLNISKNCTDPFGVLLSVGIAFNLVLYAFVNAAVVTGLFPVTGLPMPMVSYGGSGMVINMALIGILLNISQSRKSIGSKNRWSPRTYG